jgi:segregation and condensation protein B
MVSLDDLPDVEEWDPSPEEEADLRERLLRAGEARAGATPATEGGPEEAEGEGNAEPEELPQGDAAEPPDADAPADDDDDDADDDDADGDGDGDGDRA